MTLYVICTGRVIVFVPRETEDARNQQTSNQVAHEVHLLPSAQPAASAVPMNMTGRQVNATAVNEPGGLILGPNHYQHAENAVYMNAWQRRLSAVKNFTLMHPAVLVVSVVFSAFFCRVLVEQLSVLDDFFQVVNGYVFAPDYTIAGLESAMCTLVEVHYVRSLQITNLKKSTFFNYRKDL